MTFRATTSSGVLRNWKPVLLGLSVAGNLCLLALFLFRPGSPLSREAEIKSLVPKISPAGSPSGSQRRNQQREEFRAKLAAKRIPVPLYVAKKAMPGSLLKDSRVSDKLAAALAMTKAERKKVDQILSDHEKSLSDFFVRGSKEEVDAEGRPWIVVPDPSAWAEEEKKKTFTKLAEALGPARGGNCAELIKNYRPLNVSPTRTKFSITQEGGEDVVDIQSFEGDQVVGRERTVGTDNIKRDFGKVIERFAK
ncbi:hypothetical protein [Luteolibacter sp. LG18]|uniref:hypothetical protein n=1 Tax=Luteolibacter sp. LG18 TaxID=2819286 RepID=UPI002B28419D|nr:hypothetical protein llg_40170 [Luteolibacter sp. LG18]